MEIDRLGAERVTEKLTENIGTESVRAGRIAAEVVTAGSEHQLGAACGALRRQGWTIDINHQGVSALPGAASGLVIVGRPYVGELRDVRPAVWRQKFAFSGQPSTREYPVTASRMLFVKLPRVTLILCVFAYSTAAIAEKRTELNPRLDYGPIDAGT
jgi:hypothetical protein